jgi:hypothetical protein
MATHSSDGEVFGAKVLYGLMVAVAAAVLFATVASTMPGSAMKAAIGPAAQAAAAAPATEIS